MLQIWKRCLNLKRTKKKSILENFGMITTFQFMAQVNASFIFNSQDDLEHNPETLKGNLIFCIFNPEISDMRTINIATLSFQVFH